jgi:ribosome modulation factor
MKRNLEVRFYNKGYAAGIAGRSKDLCPSGYGSGRDSWLSGWRDGRTSAWEGLTGVSGIHRDPRIAS